MSGHIHELRIHVPWTKLGSEPVVITINTMECILKLRDGAQVSQARHSVSISNKVPFVPYRLVFFMTVSKWNGIWRVFDCNVMNLIRTHIYFLPYVG